MNAHTNALSSGKAVALRFLTHGTAGMTTMTLKFLPSDAAEMIRSTKAAPI